MWLGLEGDLQEEWPSCEVLGLGRVFCEPWVLSEMGVLRCGDTNVFCGWLG